MGSEMCIRDRFVTTYNGLCIFFVSGFLTARNVYRQKMVRTKQIARHLPTGVRLALLPRKSFLARMYEEKRKVKRATIVKREIVKAQRETGCVIPAAAFRRAVKQSVLRLAKRQLRVQAAAVDTLQQVAEDYLIKLMAASSRVAAHAGRQTLQKRDMRLARKLARALV